MAYDEQYAEEITKLLSKIGEFTSKKMFGSLAFFSKDKIFACIFDKEFKLKGDDETAKDFEAYGIGKHKIKGRKMAMPYYTVPQEIMHDKKKLKEWVGKAIQVAMKATKKKK